MKTKNFKLILLILVACFLLTACASIGADAADTGITVDGIAKGYIVDQGVAVLQQNGFENVLVEAGEDLMALGEKIPR